MIAPNGNAPAHGTMSRADLGRFLAGIALRPGADKGAVAQVLGQDPAAVTPRALAIVQIALGLLPVGQLTALQKAAYGKQNDAMLPTLVSNVAEVLGLLLPLGVDLEIDPAELAGLMRKHQAYGGFHLLGQQIQNGAMDQRALVGAFGAFLIDRTLEALDRRHRDPKLTEAERGRLLDDFAPALLALDEVLRYPAERRQEIGAERKALAAQVEGAKADAHLAEVQLRLRQDLVVPREELFAAARRHHEKTRGAQPDAAATALPPAPGQRRIV